MKKFIIISSNPKVYPDILGCPLVIKSLEQNKWHLEVIDLYQFGQGRYQKIDDSPYGGGAGLIILPEVIADAIEFILNKYQDYQVDLYCTSPAGKIFDQQLAFQIKNDLFEDVQSEKQKIFCLICPRFEGIDQRVIEYFSIKEISLGRFIVTNGDLVASIIINAVVRLFDNVIGNPQSLQTESFNHSVSYIEHSHYTRPYEWRGINVPDVLLGGNHKLIEQWRMQNAKEKTLKFENLNL